GLTGVGRGLTAALLVEVRLLVGVRRRRGDRRERRTHLGALHRVLDGLDHRHLRLAATTTAAAATPATATTRPGRVVAALRRGAAVLDRVVVQHVAAAVAVLAGGAERLDQALADALAGHLHQAQRGHLGHLVAGAVAAEALDEPAQHQVPVGLEHHVDEVDDDDAADVAQPQLAHDLLGRLEVVPG